MKGFINQIKTWVVVMATTVFALLANLLQAQDNLALDFKGSTFNNPNGDYIESNPSPVTGNANFTVEGWFMTTGGALTGQAFRRLFSLSSTTTRFEIGEDGTNLILFLNDVNFNSSFNVLAPISPSIWHHLAVVRNGAAVQVYLDGVSIGQSLPPLGPLNINLFRVGHWGGGTTPTQDWEGQVDEVRLWNTARTQAQILDSKDCSISVTGVSPDLLVNWTFDQMPQGVVPGGNNSGATAVDMSGNGNHGALINFTLNGPTSNFVRNTCPPYFTLNINDLGSQTNPLTAICNGDGAHFCINQNGTQVNLNNVSSIGWEYFDAIVGQWTAITGNAAFVGYCFGVPSGNSALSFSCNNSTGYLDRKFRAKITVGTGAQTCTYTSSEYLLRIDCPVSNASIGLAPQIPNSPNIALCEGTSYSTTVSLSSTHTFIPSGLPTNGNLDIQWCINGVYDPSLDDLPSFVYSGQPSFPNLCFEAKVKNGVCPTYKVNICIPVDKQPMCGLIDQISGLAQQPGGGQYDYLICAGGEAQIAMNNALDFKDCDAVWQYHFDTDPVGTWHNLLGTSNPVQNTNTLPQSLSPYLWPPTATCITYRIECRPKHYPFSDCLPCHSNEVEICLTPPLQKPTICLAPMQFCQNNAAQLSVCPFDPAVIQYDWYCNAIYLGSGPTIPATQAACYWLEAFDGCMRLESDKACLEECAIIPVIECPLGSPCVCLGEPVTLSGCNSVITCQNTGPLPLTYTWSSNGAPCVAGGPNGCECTTIPDPGGTTYTLTICDPNLGCCWTETFYIKPCF